MLPNLLSTTRAVSSRVVVERLLASQQSQLNRYFSTHAGNVKNDKRPASRNTAQQKTRPKNSPNQSTTPASKSKTDVPLKPSRHNASASSSTTHKPAASQTASTTPSKINMSPVYGNGTYTYNITPDELYADIEFNINICKNAGRPALGPSLDKETYEHLLKTVTTQSEYNRLCERVLADINTVISLQRNIVTTPPYDPVKSSSFRGVHPAVKQLDSSAPTLMQTESEYTVTAFRQHQYREQEDRVFNVQGEGHYRYIYNYNIFPLARALFLVRSFIQPSLQRFHPEPSSAILLEPSPLLPTIYKRIFDLISESPIPVHPENIAYFCSAARRDRVLVDSSLVTSMMNAFAHSGDVMATLSFAEVAFGFDSPAAQQLLNMLATPESRPMVQHALSPTPEVLRAVFDCCYKLQLANYVPALWQAMVYRSLPLDRMVLQRMTSVLVASGDIASLPSLLRTAAAEGVVLQERQLNMLLNSLNTNVITIIDTLSDTTPAKLRELLAKDSPAAQHLQRYPVCSYVAATTTTNAIYHTNATQVHTLVTVVRLFEALFAYARQHQLLIDAVSATSIITFYVRVGMHAEALALVTAMMRQNTGYDDPLTTLQHARSTAHALDASSFMSQALMDNVNALTCMLRSRMFPNKRALRELFAGEDAYIVDAEAEHRLQLAFSAIADTEGLTAQDVLHAQLLLLMGNKELANAPARKRKLMEGLFRLTGDNAEEHNSPAFLQARCLHATLVKFAPVALKQALDLTSTSSVQRVCDLASSVSTPEDAIATLDSLPMSSLQLFNYTELRLGAPDSVCLMAALQTIHAGMHVECASLLEASILFTRLHCIIESTRGDALTVTDATLLEVLRNFSHRYNLPVPGATSSSISFTPSPALRNAARSMSFSPDVYTTLLYLTQVSGDFCFTRYILQIISRAFGIPTTLVPSIGPAGEHVEVLSLLAMQVLARDGDLEPVFANVRAYRMRKKVIYTSMPQRIPDDLSQLSAPQPLSRLMCGAAEYVPIFSLDLTDKDSPAAAFSIFSPHNVAGSNALSPAAAIDIAAVCATPNAHPALQVLERLPHAEAFLEDMRMSPLQEASVRARVAVQRTGVMSHFTQAYAVNLHPAAGLATQLASTHLRSVAQSWLVEASLRLIKELTNVAAYQGVPITQSLVSLLTRMIPIENELTGREDRTLFTSHAPSLNTADVEATVRSQLGLSSDAPTLLPHSLVHLADRLFAGSHVAVDTLKAVTESLRREDPLFALTALLDTSRAVDVPQLPLPLADAAVITSESLLAAPAVEAYALLTAFTEPQLQALLPADVAAALLETVPELASVVNPSALSPEAARAHLMLQLKLPLALRLKLHLDSNAAVRMLPLTRAHLSLTVATLLQAIMPEDDAHKSPSTSIAHNPFFAEYQRMSAHATVKPALHSRVLLNSVEHLRGAIPQLVKLIRAGCHDQALATFEQLLAVTPASLDVLTSTLSTLIHAFTTAGRGDLALRLFRERVMPSRITFGHVQNFDRGSLSDVVLSTPTLMTLLQAIRVSSTPLQDCVEILHYAAVHNKRYLGEDVVSKAITSLAQCGYQREALELFMVTTQPDYMRSIVDTHTTVWIGTGNASTQAGAPSASVGAATSTESDKRIRTVFADDSPPPPVQLDDHAVEAQLVTDSDSVVAERVRGRMGEVPDNAAFIAAAKAAAATPVPALTPVSNTAVASAHAIVRVGETLPIAEGPLPVGERFCRADADAYVAHLSAANNLFIPSPFTIALVQTLHPYHTFYGSVTSYPFAVKMPSPSEPIYVAALRACSEGPATYPDFALQVFLSFMHTPTFSLRAYKQTSYAVHLSRELLVKHDRMIRVFSEQGEKFSPTSPANRAAVDEIARKMAVQHSVQVGLTEIMVNLGVGPDPCFFNGHVMFTDVESLYSNLSLGDDTLDKNEDALGRISGCRFGLNGAVDTSDLPKQRTFIIPAISASVREVHLMYLYNVFVHPRSPLMRNADVVSDNQINQHLDDIVRGVTGTDCSEGVDGSDASFIETAVAHRAVTEQVFRHVRSVSKYTHIANTKFFQPPGETNWLERIDILRHKSLPQMLMHK